MYTHISTKERCAQQFMSHVWGKTKPIFYVH